MRSALVLLARRRVAVVQRAAAVTLPSSSFHTTTCSPKKESDKNWADPVARQYKFWNRESSKPGQYSFLIEMSPESIQREAKIVSLSDPADPANVSLHQGALPLGASLLGVGTTVETIETSLGPSSSLPNVLFVSPSCPRAAAVLPAVLSAYPSIQWVHCRSAGIDFIESEDFTQLAIQRNLAVTNAKGQFSSSLAEYALAACSYFAKDFARLARQQQAKQWKNYDIEELCV